MLADVTQRRLYEQKLQVSEKRLTTALETANAIFWDWMIPGDELLLSEDWEKKTGFPLPRLFKIGSLSLRRRMRLSFAK